MGKNKKKLPQINGKQLNIVEKVNRYQTSVRIGKLLYWSAVGDEELLFIESELQKYLPDKIKIPVIQIFK